MAKVTAQFPVYLTASSGILEGFCELNVGNIFEEMKRNTSIIKTVWILVCFTYACGLSESDKALILRMHNDLRRNVANGNEISGLQSSDMKKMTWNLELQREAEALLDCSYSDARRDDPTQIHTNTGASRNESITGIIQSWVSEKQQLRTDAGYPTCLNLANCNRYLKMINSKHYRIGCAYATCVIASQNTNLFVCKYDGGHILVPPFKQGIPCTGCDGDKSFCENGLCVPCTPNSGPCDCRKTCNKTDIGTGVLNNDTCTCNCSYGLGPNCDQDCVNPRHYIDFDICSLFTTDDCSSPFHEDILRESCPATCTCRRHPNASRLNDAQ